MCLKKDIPIQEEYTYTDYFTQEKDRQNEKTINYVSKYMTKKDEDNPEYTGKVLCSPGLGAGYIKRIGERHEWKGEETKEDYYTRQGTLIALPKYYKYKLFTEEQREQLWIYREESNIS